MVTKDEAEAIARQHLKAPGEIVVAPEEHPWGWMIHYYAKHGQLLGNVPVYVTHDGVYHPPVTGSAQQEPEHLALFERKLKHSKRTWLGKLLFRAP